MSLNEFEVIKRLGKVFLASDSLTLGEGAYSSVYHVKRHMDGQIYALKKVKMVKLSEKEKENALNEVRILASIQHPSICSYHEAFIDEPSQSLW
jgi:NIMA (never in mitosis gene a)-related kinase